MKKIVSILVALLFISGLVNSQPLTRAEKDFSYTFLSYEGTNASAVVWEPVQKFYITLIAGNSDFPLEVFDGSGKCLFSDVVKLDSRGMWYNPKTKRIEINAYDDSGWAYVKFNEKFNYHAIDVFYEGMHQPEYNACGTYYPKKKSVIFLNEADMSIDLYRYKNPKKISKIKLDLRQDNMTEYNTTSLGFTGKKGYEFVLLNVERHLLDFFDSKGQYAGSTELPGSAITNGMFRFAYANDRVFLYDIDERTWTAYKVF